MAVNSFKFVSPGIFINEIDNSFIPREAEAIGPVVVGRATRGLAMQPVKVQSYSEFVEMFGDTVPGNAGGDVYRNGNYQSPMYGTYAAKAFLGGRVAPLTYVRLLGQQSTNNDGTADSRAGWKTSQVNLANGASAGGAYGLFIAPSASLASDTVAEYTGSNSFQLAAVIYVQSGSVQLSGNLAGPSNEANVVGSSTIINSDDNGNFKLVVNGATSGTKTFTVNMADTSGDYIRDVLNTNPQKASTQGAFYASASYEDYWLGETFEQEMLDAGLTSGNLVGVIAGLMSGSAFAGPANMKNVPSQEAIAGWFIGQDTGDAASYNPAAAQKLFRLIGRGHGEWLHKNCKVSIENIKPSTTISSPYGSFSVVIRDIRAGDKSREDLERFDNCNLNPSSPNYIARLIGDMEQRWDSATNSLKSYGTYPNLSRYVRVEMDETIDSSGGDALLPFGYYGPPKLKDVTALEATGSAQVESSGKITNRYLVLGTGLPGYTDTTGDPGLGRTLSSSFAQCTASFAFPQVRLRVSASANSLNNSTARFGLDTYLNTTNRTQIGGIGDVHRLWIAGLADADQGYPTDATNSTDPAINGYSYIFTLDNISGSLTSFGSQAVYVSGSRKAGNSYTAVNDYVALVQTIGVDKFTAPFWGGFDGFDITKPDPLYNNGMSDSSTEENSYAYHTYARAIQTVADPEYINMNLLSVPGLTNNKLTSLMVETCEERADALALIDLPNVYIPTHERYYANKTSRIGTTPQGAATALKNRRLDSSYGATFYPWVQTTDANGAVLWIPPSVAMMGVLASSEASSEIWFAPAGFNRGGLSRGNAANIPISAVSERLTSKNRDILYEARINPIASFPSEGIVVFGQKTLQERQSALDRINVRRLVIYLKKQISILSTQVLFEQNVQSTWNNFKALINPLLADVQNRSGITDYRLILDTSTTTPDLIDRNILYAKIMVKPARAIEYIAIDFVIASSGASFDD